MISYQKLFPFISFSFITKNDLWPQKVILNYKVMKILKAVKFVFSIPHRRKKGNEKNCV